MIIHSYIGYNHHWPYNNQSQLQNPYQSVPKSYHPYPHNQPNPHRPQNVGEAEYQIHQSTLTQALSSVAPQYALPAPRDLLNRIWSKQAFHQQPTYKGPSWTEQIPPTVPSNCQGLPRSNQESKRIHDPLKGQSWPMQEPYLRPGKLEDLSKGPKEIHSAQIKPQDLSKGPPRLVSSANNHPGQLRPYR